jgi:hypothetical protein
MSDDPFSRVPRRRPASLIDLAETKTPEATHAFVAQATRIAETTGGRVAMANEALARPGAMAPTRAAGGRSAHLDAELP